MLATSSTASVSLRRSLLAGLAAGGVAAIAAALVSLPLRSPDDAFFNTASVTFGALLAGVLGGALWFALRARRDAPRMFAVVLAAAFLLVSAGALLMDVLPSAPLDGMTRFVVPLAAIVFGGVAVLTPVLARPSLRPEMLAPVAAIPALVLGIALAGRGDAESGKLSLPALSSSPSQSGAAGGAGTNGATATDASSAGAASEGIVRPKDVAGAAFAVAKGDSTATYTVREKLAQLPLPSEAVGKTSDVTGTIYLDGRPSKVTVDLRTLQSDRAQRDNFIRTRGGVQSERYPFAEFTVMSLDLPTEYRPGETVTRNVSGTMKIREVEKPMTFAVEARLLGSELQVVGRTDFTWADFQIPPPNIGGFVQVEDNVHVEVLLVARKDGAD